MDLYPELLLVESHLLNLPLSCCTVFIFLPLSSSFIVLTLDLSSPFLSFLSVRLHILSSAGTKLSHSLSASHHLWQPLHFTSLCMSLLSFSFSFCCRFSHQTRVCVDRSLIPPLGICMFRYASHHGISITVFPFVRNLSHKRPYPHQEEVLNFLPAIHRESLPRNPYLIRAIRSQANSLVPPVSSSNDFEVPAFLPMDSVHNIFRPTPRLAGVERARLHHKSIFRIFPLLRDSFVLAESHVHTHGPVRFTPFVLPGTLIDSASVIKAPIAFIWITDSPHHVHPPLHLLPPTPTHKLHFTRLEATTVAEELSAKMKCVIPHSRLTL